MVLHIVFLNINNTGRQEGRFYRCLVRCAYAEE